MSNIDDFKAALGGDIIIAGLERPGALSITETLALRSWFDKKRKLVSTGGRPSNPEWTLKRQIPMSARTWDSLQRLAAQMSTFGARIGPGQAAAFLLEDAVNARKSDQDEPNSRLTPMPADIEPRFRDWRQPVVFSGHDPAA